MNMYNKNRNRHDLAYKWHFCFFVSKSVLPSKHVKSGQLSARCCYQPSLILKEKAFAFAFCLSLHLFCCKQDTSYLKDISFLSGITQGIWYVQAHEKQAVLRQQLLKPWSLFCSVVTAVWLFLVSAEAIYR